MVSLLWLLHVDEAGIKKYMIFLSSQRHQHTGSTSCPLRVNRKDGVLGSPLLNICQIPNSRMPSSGSIHSSLSGKGHLVVVDGGGRMIGLEW